MNKNNALISAVSPHIYLQQPIGLCFFFKWFKLHYYVNRAKFNNLAFCSACMKVMLVHLCSTSIHTPTVDGVVSLSLPSSPQTTSV